MEHSVLDPVLVFKVDFSDGSDLEGYVSFLEVDQDPSFIPERKWKRRVIILSGTINESDIVLHVLPVGSFNAPLFSVTVELHFLSNDADITAV